MPKVERSVIQREHPDRSTWMADEDKMRASYLATSAALAPYLVLHRFEGNEDMDPTELRRSQLGYGIGLNQAYLSEVLGHIQGATATYSWGGLAPQQEAPDTQAPDDDSMARLLWDDATRDNITWSNLWADVLEWMLTSPASVLVADVTPGQAVTQAEARATGMRPYLRRVPVSAVEDIGVGPQGIRWVKLTETVDTRMPLMEGGEAAEVRHIVYWLDEQDRTLVARFDDEGNPLPVPGTGGEVTEEYPQGAPPAYEVDMGQLVDPQGQPRLPILVAKFGQHPTVEWLGTGLLMGLDDIVVDLYNTLTEVREGYRDAAFGMLVHQGPDPEQVAKQLSDGTRLVHLGDATDAKMERLAADASEVQAGLSLLDLGIRSWALSAKRKADEATERAGARSGISLQAEFQLDIRPLLVAITNALDEVETLAMQVLAQLADDGVGAEDLSDLWVQRDTEFQLEDEAARISRIVSEWTTDAGQTLVPSQYVPIAMRWTEATALVDMDEQVPTVDGAEVERSDVVEQELQAQAESKERAARQVSEFPIL